jgi:Flp pilus assembly protein CpaB
MNKNLLPLLAVAFIVAVVSTGIFYTLFVGKLKSAPSQTMVVAATALPPGSVITKANLKTLTLASAELPRGMYSNESQVIGQTVALPIEQDEPVLASRLSSWPGPASAGVPVGMRAVSVHVSDSSGILSMLKPGHKVDLQVFASRPTPAGIEREARTAFQNVPVLAVGTQPELSSQGNFNAPAVTLLVRAQDADALGLADSFGRIRLALRNPGDGAIETKSSVPFSAVLKDSVPAALAGAGTRRGPGAGARSATSQVSFSVQLLSVSEGGIAELARHGVRRDADLLDASQVSSPSDLDRTLARLRTDKAVDTLSLSQLTAAVSRSAAVEWQGNDSGGLRVRFSPFMARGLMKLKVQPEILGARPEAGLKQGFETEIDISSGRSFVISGFPVTSSSTDRRRLLMLVKPDPVKRSL